MDLKKHWESFAENLKGDVLEYYAHQAKIYSTEDLDKYATAFDLIKHLRKNIMDAITVKDQETYWIYLIKYQEAMIRLFKQMVDDLTWGCQENMTEEVFDDFAKPFKGNWKKFSRFYIPPKVEIANTDENVYDWMKPLRAL